MEKSLFAFIWRHSRLQQFAVLALVLASFPFLYYSLDLPKTIINKAIGGKPDGSYSVLGLDMSQLQYLAVLCGMFLALVCVNGWFKYRINIQKGVMAERLLRRQRFIMVEHALRFPLPQFQKTSAGEVVTMVTAEVEPLGGFFGDALALPLFQGGTFLTILAFMFVQDPWLGLAAFAAVPLQAYLIPRMQRKINALGKDRVRHVRALSNRLGEMVDGIQDMRANNAAPRTLADIAQRLGQIFWIRFEIYNRKFMMKFVNNFINQMTPFFFYAIGGYLVIMGDLTFGALVAALAAYKDLAAPWKELLDYYQRMADARIKYEQLQSQFDLPGLMPEKLRQDRPQPLPHLTGPITARNLTVEDEDGVKPLEAASFTIPAGSLTAIIGSNAASRDRLGLVLARLIVPNAGIVQVGDADLALLPEAVTGARIGLVGGRAGLFSGTILENIRLGVDQAEPPMPTDETRRAALAEAKKAGNSSADIEQDWLDRELVGTADPTAFRARLETVLERAGLRDDLIAIGLRMPPDAFDTDTAERFVEARRRVEARLAAAGLGDLVRRHDPDAFNPYASIAENLLFGEPTDPALAPGLLGGHPVIRAALARHGLTERFFELGVKAAELVTDLFRDLPSGHPFFEQYSFVDEEVLPQLDGALRRLRNDNAASLPPDDRALIESLPFLLVVQRHRLGMIDETLRNAVLALRQDLRQSAPELLHGVSVFDPDRLTPGLTLLDNVLFGRVAYGRAAAAERVPEVVREVLGELDLLGAVLQRGLGFDVGVGGSKLGMAQRLRLSLARQLLKRPDMLIVSDGLAGLDNASRDAALAAMRADLPDATLIWIDHEAPPGVELDCVLHLKSGKVLATESAEPAQSRPDQQQEEAGALEGELRLLRDLPVFAAMDPAKLKLLAFTSDVKSFAAGETLVRQGDSGSTAYMILSGQADIVVERPDRTENVLFAIGPGRMVGELALLCETPRSATVRATSSVTALELRPEVFAELARQDADFAYAMTRDLARRLIDTTNRI